MCTAHEADSDKGKAALMESVLSKMAKSVEETGKLSESEAKFEPPTTILWYLFFSTCLN